MNLNNILAAAIASSAPARVDDHPYDSLDTFSTSTATRVCAGWANINRAALTYEGESAEALTSELASIDTKIEFHKKEVIRLRSELIKQTGGPSSVNAATAAGMEIIYDMALVTGQHDNERARYALSLQRDKINNVLVTAQASACAKSELTAILAALIGGLQ